MLFRPGDTIADFAVLFPCGAGAFGQVYLVRDGSGRECALKVLSPDRRGERELAGLLRFQRVAHPSLLHIDRISTLPDGRIFYTMDAADHAESGDTYVPDTLARRMRERKVIPPDELKKIMLELAEGLAALHRAHLIHRDIKPENILFVRGRATLADAGAVGEFDGTTLVGTPDYLPPEVCLGKRRFTAADDCCALGLVLYSALTGETPRKFPSTPRTLMSPEEVALFKTAQRACTPPGISAYRFRELLEHPEKTAPRRQWRWIAFAAAAVILCMALAAAALHSKRPPAPAPTPEKKTATVQTPEKKTDPAPTPEKKPAPAMTPAERARASVAYSEAFVRKMKADEAALRAEQARIKSPKVQPVETKRRDEVASAGSETTTAAELLEKYRLTAEEQKLVDKWMAECVAFDRKINAAYMARDNARVAKLMAEKEAKLPYGIAEFCGDEMRIRKYLDILTRDYTPRSRRRLEAALQYRRDGLKKVLDVLPPEELAKWR